MLDTAPASPKKTPMPPPEVTAKIPCRYFRSGSCRYGQHCLFSHSLLPAVHPSYADHVAPPPLHHPDMPVYYPDMIPDMSSFPPAYYHPVYQPYPPFVPNQHPHTYYDPSHQYVQQYQPLSAPAPPSSTNLVSSNPENLKESAEEEKEPAVDSNASPNNDDAENEQPRQQQPPSLHTFFQAGAAVADSSENLTESNLNDSTKNRITLPRTVAAPPVGNNPSTTSTKKNKFGFSERPQCRFFEDNKCGYVDECHYRHTLPDGTDARTLRRNIIGVDGLTLSDVPPQSFKVLHRSTAPEHSRRRSEFDVNNNNPLSFSTSSATRQNNHKYSSRRESLPDGTSTVVNGFSSSSSPYHHHNHHANNNNNHHPNNHHHKFNPSAPLPSSSFSSHSQFNGNHSSSSFIPNGNNTSNRHHRAFNGSKKDKQFKKSNYNNNNNNQHQYPQNTGQTRLPGDDDFPALPAAIVNETSNNGPIFTAASRALPQQALAAPHVNGNGAAASVDDEKKQVNGTDDTEVNGSDTTTTTPSSTTSASSSTSTQSSSTSTPTVNGHHANKPAVLPLANSFASAVKSSSKPAVAENHHNSKIASAAAPAANGPNSVSPATA